MPVVSLAPIIEKKTMTESVFMLKLDAPEIAKTAFPGQFIHVRCGAENLLRRPISICDVKDGVVTTVIEVRGEGTRWLDERRPGEVLDLLGPLGHGFDVNGENIILVGGGIGVPPMLYTARKAAGNVTAILGFRTDSCILLKDEFDRICNDVCLTTDDGSAGERGFVTTALERYLKNGGFDTILACGPKVMLKAVAELSAQYSVDCQVSLEERMGCGVGACLVCACQTVGGKR